MCTDVQDFSLETAYVGKNRANFGIESGGDNSTLPINGMVFVDGRIKMMKYTRIKNKISLFKRKYLGQMNNMQGKVIWTKNSQETRPMEHHFYNSLDVGPQKKQPQAYLSIR